MPFPLLFHGFLALYFLGPPLVAAAVIEAVLRARSPARPPRHRFWIFLLAFAGAWTVAVTTVPGWFPLDSRFPL